MPRCFIGTSTHKGQALGRYTLCILFTTQRVYALAKGDGSPFPGCRYSSFQRGIARFADPCFIRFSGAGCVIRKSQHGKHLKHHCHCQQGRQKPVLTFLFQLSSFLSSLFHFCNGFPARNPPDSYRTVTSPVGSIFRIAGLSQAAECFVLKGISCHFIIPPPP